MISCLTACDQLSCYHSLRNFPHNRPAFSVGTAFLAFVVHTQADQLRPVHTAKESLHMDQVTTDRASTHVCCCSTSAWGCVKMLLPPPEANARGMDG